MEKDYFNTVKDKCLRDGVYVKYFIKDCLQEQISKIFEKDERRQLCYSVSGFDLEIDIECFFSKGQKKDMIYEHIWDTQTLENKLIVKMYCPLEENHFESETRTLFDTFDEIYKLSSVINSGSENLTLVIF